MQIFHKSELATLHPTLYKRVRLKGLIGVIYGFLLAFGHWLPFVDLPESNTATSGPSAYASFAVLGSIWMILGFLTLFHLYIGEHSYVKSRRYLWALLVWVIFWFSGIIVAMIFGGERQPSTIVFFGYLAYNIWIIIQDSGWAGAELVKQFKEHEREN